MHLFFFNLLASHFWYSIVVNNQMLTVNLEKDPLESKGFSAMKRSKTGIYFSIYNTINKAN